MTSSFLLRAWTANPSTKSNLWKWYSKRVSLGDVQHSFQQVGSLPGGFSVHIQKRLQFTNHQIAVVSPSGEIALLMYFSLEKKYVKMETVVVNPAYQGKGLAFTLYEWLINKYGGIESDSSLSAGASKMWMRLIQKHRGFLKVTVGGKVRLVDILDFAELKGVWYPVVNRGGTPTSLGELERKATGPEKKALEESVYLVRK